MTDAELSRAVQSRDEAAMEVIINRYSRLLWRVCAAVLSKSGGTQDVEECVADAFVYLWRYPERYDSSRSTLKTFLCMVARSRAMDRYRSLMRSRTVPMEEGLAAQTLDISAQALSSETRQELTAALHTLPEEEQDMVFRVMNEEKTKITSEMVANLRSHSGSLTEAKIKRYLSKNPIKKKCYKVPARIVEKYFDGMDPNTVDSIVEQALAAWFGKENADV